MGRKKEIFIGNRLSPKGVVNKQYGSVKNYRQKNRTLRDALVQRDRKVIISRLYTPKIVNNLP